MGINNCSSLPGHSPSTSLHLGAGRVSTAARVWEPANPHLSQPWWMTLALIHTTGLRVCMLINISQEYTTSDQQLKEKKREKNMTSLNTRYGKKKKRAKFEPIRAIAAVTTAARRQAGSYTHTVHMVPRGGSEWHMLNKANRWTNIAAKVYYGEKTQHFTTTLHKPAAM